MIFGQGQAYMQKKAYNNSILRSGILILKPVSDEKAFLVKNLDQPGTS